MKHCALGIMYKYRQIKERICKELIITKWIQHFAPFENLNFIKYVLFLFQYAVVESESNEIFKT